MQDNNVDKIQPSEALAKLPVGTYYLWSEVPATEDYDRLAADEAYEFKVMKAHNSWEEAPSIESWVEGKYDETVNVITAKAYFGKAVIIITARGRRQRCILRFRKRRKQA